MKFEVVKCSTGKMNISIKAQCAEIPGMSMTVYLDKAACRVNYPVEIIIPHAAGMMFVLESDETCSCTFPPTASETTIDSMVKFLRLFHNIVDAARELIEKEISKCSRSRDS